MSKFWENVIRTIIYSLIMPLKVFGQEATTTLCYDAETVKQLLFLQEEIAILGAVFLMLFIIGIILWFIS